ncbi:MAG: hypothetical protein HQ402_02790 [Parcubacteria group bacterium]|nr:hypothetical protein [Parcubacteria group bacterium]
MSQKGDDKSTPIQTNFVNADVNSGLNDQATNAGAKYAEMGTTYAVGATKLSTIRTDRNDKTRLNKPHPYDVIVGGFYITKPPFDKLRAVCFNLESKKT